VKTEAGDEQVSEEMVGVKEETAKKRKRKVEVDGVEEGGSGR